MQCAACGAENPAGHRFCGQCGRPLERACAACGAPAGAAERFCGRCGTALDSEAGTPFERITSGIGERRLVTVLFADLVGFTPFSEARDPEEVREVLERYFARCQALIGRYGGVVQKFIGDAIVAVWGSPVTREDDAERAVRAALDVVAEVAALGQEIGESGLRARAGVLTGRAAVRVGAEAEGSVVGDAVNTAARIQSVAAPGTVLVDDATRRVTESSIVYEDGGLHELKGKSAPRQTWRPLRVVAGVGGGRRLPGLEAPFVGRDAELLALRDAFDAVAAGAGAQVRWLVGEAGMGKSRLAWELEKRLDGLTDVVHWHRGRCLAYGDGVAFWALAEMVRMRCRIGADDDPGSARAKLAATLAQQVPDEAERALVEPRVAALLGLDAGPQRDQADLFAGWRLFFERLSDVAPVVMVFEDLQWADAGMLDFIDHLAEWSARHPILVLALARPEVTGRRALEGQHVKRLAPLSTAAVEALLGGLVPGLGSEVGAAVAARADGIPLYAVETVRMLLDRGLLEARGSAYVLTGPVEDADVPESLHALVAARLDALSALERRVVSDAAVLGSMFSAEGVAALSGLGSAEARAVLDGLALKQVLALDDDPRSPQRGQYAFLQSTLQRVAYERLGRRERKARHLAAAAHLHPADDETGEPADILAAHYLAAADCDPAARDTAEILALARRTLTESGHRALSLAAGDVAHRRFVRAAELTGPAVERARLLELAGYAAELQGDGATAAARYREARELLREAGEPRRAAGLAALIARAHQRLEPDPALLGELEAAHAELSGAVDEPAIEVAEWLALTAFRSGDPDRALAVIDAALEGAELLGDRRLVLNGFNRRAMFLLARGRFMEATALYRHALDVALQSHHRAAAGSLDYAASVDGLANNLAFAEFSVDRYEEALGAAELGLEHARRRGDHVSVWYLETALSSCLTATGNWDEALALAPPDDRAPLELRIGQLTNRAFILAARGLEPEGDVAGAAALLDSGYYLNRALAAASRAVAARAAGDNEAAREAGRVGLEVVAEHDVVDEARTALIAGLEAALELGDAETVEEAFARLDGVLRVRQSPFLVAQLARFRARLAAARGDGAAGPHFEQALAGLQALPRPFDRAVVTLEHAEWLAAAGREAEAAAGREQAAATFAKLSAAPWLERARRAAMPAG